MNPADIAEEQVLTVRSMMTANPITISPEASVLSAIELMNRHNIGAVVAVEDGRPVGIFTERDVVRQATQACDQWQRMQVRDVMTRHLHTIAPDELWNAALDALHRHAVRHMPVVQDGRLVGMLSVRDIMKHRTGLLESIVQQRTAELLRQKRAIEARDRERTRSLEIAGRIQSQILPSHAPDFAPFEIAYAFQPQDQVAGDYYDFEVVRPDTLRVVIGDASGHGIAAALVSVIANTCFRVQLGSSATPAELLSAMNEILYGWVDAEHFISMFVAALDRSTLKMTFARAGHPFPLLVPSSGNDIRPLGGGGVMLGVLPDPQFTDQTVQLEPGDRVLLYTDGLTECHDGSGHLFGIERVKQRLARDRSLPCEAVVSNLVREAREFVSGRPFADDLTVVLAQVGRPADPAGAFGP